MRRAYVFAVAVLAVAALPLAVSDDSAAVSAGDVFSTVEFPNYGPGEFFSDLFGIGSALGGSGLALKGFGKFIAEDTFFNPSVGLSTYVSVFFLICLIVMIFCIVLAVVSMLKHKREYID